MGCYDTIWFKDKTGEDVDIQYKAGECSLRHFEVGDTDENLNDGIYFCPEGCFVIYQQKITAVFQTESLFDKWGRKVEYPELVSPLQEALSKMEFKKTD